MTTERKLIRDDKTGKVERRDSAFCHYDNKCSNKFTVNISDKLKTEMTMQQAIAIAVTHRMYLEDFRNNFVEWVNTRYGEMADKSDPLALVKDRPEFDKFFLEFEGIFLDNLASMKSSILSFMVGLAHNCDFGNEDKLW